MKFNVIDKKTGKEANTTKIALKEEWASNLIYCDMEGFYIGEDGTIILADECGNFAYAPEGRFEIVFEREPCEDAVSTKEIMRILTLLMSEAGKDGKLILSDAKAMIYDLPSVYTKTECEDAVGRQAVINAIKSVPSGNWTNKRYLQEIDELPSVQPKAKTGHWIDKDEKSAVCSCCNRNNTLYGDFCKWCGAKMVEPQESEDKE